MVHRFLTLCIGLILFCAAETLAQIPQTIGYQGVLTDASGNKVPDGGYNLTFKLYDGTVTPNELWKESQIVQIRGGVFSVQLGAATALGSLAFDKPYYLGISIDGGAELAPRTALAAAPYALNAERARTASALAPGATGVVTNLNGADGALTLEGGGGTTINRSGNKITISSTGGGGSGIQGVQNTDGKLTVTNPNGPTATINLAPGAQTRVNSISGDVNVVGTGGTTVTQSGQTITINSTGGGGSGIQTVQNSDQTLLITNPSGPVTTVDMAQGKITADKLAPGTLPTINGISGPVTLSGGGGTTINQSGSTITITSTGGGGTGIQGVQNTDGTLDIQNPNGPTATLNINNGAITENKLANNSVSTTKIQDGSVTAAKLASGVIPGSLPPSGAAGGDLTGSYPNPTIANNAVTSAKIADGTIVSADLADNAVATAKIADAAVTAAKLASGVIPGSLPPSGAAGGDLTGSYPDPTIGNNAVTSAKIADGTIVTADLADNAVATVKIANDAVTAAKLANDAVTTAKIAADAVTTAKLANDAVTSAKIANGTIATDDLANGAVTRAKISSSVPIPVCYGVVDASGTIGSGSGNFSVSKTGTGRFEITITGYSYNIWSYPTVVSLMGGTPGLFIRNGSLSGKMLIYIDSVTAPADAHFNFIVYY